jgi:sodium transport system permease protein
LQHPRNYRRVWVVFKKELLDTLRDRRTVVAMVVVPLVLYPALMLVMVEALRTETGRRRAERYSVCVTSPEERLWLMSVLQHEDDEARRVRKQVKQDSGGKDSGEDSDFLATLVADQFDIAVADERTSLWDVVNNQTYQAGLIVEPTPKGVTTPDRVNRTVQIIYRDTDPRSEFLYRQLARVLDNEAGRTVRARVMRLPGGEANLTPLCSQGLSTASPKESYAKILAMIVPFLLVIMSVTGALYPAIDLTAGERERGTLETLAVSPVPVGQIVAGKFGVIVTVSMISTALNLASMSAVIYFSKIEQLTELTRRHDTSAVMSVEQQSAATQPMAVGAAKSLRQVDYVRMRQQLEDSSLRRSSLIIRAAPIVLLAMVPFSVLSAAVMLAACSFARTFKEAQYYMMPVMMAAILPAMVVSYMPTIKLEGILLVIPVANIVVLIRELFLGQYSATAIVVPVLSTAFYAAAAVTLAARLYAHEAVLFSDVGNYSTLIRRRFIKPSIRPGPAMALVAVAVCFPFYFYWQSFWIDAHVSGERFRVVIAAGQVLILALPALLLSWYMRLDIRETFSFRLPRVLPGIGALMMAPVMLTVSVLMQQVQLYFLPTMQSGEEVFRQQSELMLGGSMWSAIAVFAVVPAICEELLFRGFLTGALRTRVKTWTVVVCVGLIFGLFHIHIEKLIITSLLGMLLTFVCISSRSIFPAMIMHVAQNGLGIAAGYAENSWLREQLAIPSESLQAGTIIFNTRVATCLAIFVIGLVLTFVGREKHATPAY